MGGLAKKRGEGRRRRRRGEEEKKRPPTTDRPSGKEEKEDCVFLPSVAWKKRRKKRSRKARLPLSSPLLAWAKQKSRSEWGNVRRRGKKAPSCNGRRNKSGIGVREGKNALVQVSSHGCGPSVATPSSSFSSSFSPPPPTYSRHALMHSTHGSTPRSPAYV